MLETKTSLFDVQNRIAVVTGSSSGIGLALSQTLATMGANVVLVARSADLLENQCQAIRSQGGSAYWVDVDLLDRNAIEGSHARVCDCFGAPEIVINAAGVNLRESAEDVTWESWDQTINLNLSIPFFYSRFFVDEMKRAGWGRIINIASLQSRRAFSNSISYGASKGGVAQLTRAMAECWSNSGIMCNAIAPGFFRTSLTAPVFDDPETSQKMAASTAVGRNGTMEDLQGPLLFLASRASDYVTGQILYVDGGFSAK